MEELPELPQKADPTKYSTTVMFWDGQRWIAFNHDRWLESSVEYEDLFRGPFVVTDEPPPRKEELAEVKEKGKPPRREKEMYGREGQLLPPPK